MTSSLPLAAHGIYDMNLTFDSIDDELYLTLFCYVPCPYQSITLHLYCITCIKSLLKWRQRCYTSSIVLRYQNHPHPSLKTCKWYHC